MSGAPPRIVPFGEAAFLVELGGGIDADVDRRVQAVAAAVRADAEGGWGCPVPASDSVLVTFDPLSAAAGAAAERLAALLATAPPAPAGPRAQPPTMEIPVRYGGPDGPDLEAVAAQLGLTPEQVVEVHVGTTYRVQFLGFAPGFAYLGRLPERIAVARRDTPRTRVPAGSVAIAGLQTAVYPGAMPGGWNLIGRTDRRVWDVRRDPPALFQAGVLVRFVPARG